MLGFNYAVMREIAVETVQMKENHRNSSIWILVISACSSKIAVETVQKFESHRNSLIWILVTSACESKIAVEIAEKFENHRNSLIWVLVTSACESEIAVEIAEKSESHRILEAKSKKDVKRIEIEPLLLDTDAYRTKKVSPVGKDGRDGS